MRVKDVMARGNQFPFIRIWGFETVCTTFNTDGVMHQNVKKARRMEEYVSICMGFEMKFVDYSFRKV